jgi:hypothetical protein
VALDPWGPILGRLFEDKSSDYILGVLQRAGVPTAFNLTDEEAYSHTTRKRAYLKRLDQSILSLHPPSSIVLHRTSRMRSRNRSTVYRVSMQRWTASAGYFRTTS